MTSSAGDLNRRQVRRSASWQPLVAGGAGCALGDAIGLDAANDDDDEDGHARPKHDVAIQGRWLSCQKEPQPSVQQDHTCEGDRPCAGAVRRVPCRFACHRRLGPHADEAVPGQPLVLHEPGQPEEDCADYREQGPGDLHADIVAQSLVAA